MKYIILPTFWSLFGFLSRSYLCFVVFEVFCSFTCPQEQMKKYTHCHHYAPSLCPLTSPRNQPPRRTEAQRAAILTRRAAAPADLVSVFWGLHCPNQSTKNYHDRGRSDRCLLVEMVKISPAWRGSPWSTRTQRVNHRIHCECRVIFHASVVAVKCPTEKKIAFAINKKGHMKQSKIWFFGRGVSGITRDAWS